MGKLSPSGRADFIRRELEAIRQRDKKGELRPDAVLDFAQDPRTQLHKKFTWDDGEAAHQFRLSQAREIIRTFVVMVHSPIKGVTHVLVKEMVSLSDRRGEDGGYIPIVEVLDDAAKRRRLLLDVIARLEGVTEVALFTELKEVHEAITAVRRRFPDAFMPAHRKAS